MQHFRPPFSDQEDDKPTVSIWWIKRAMCPARFGDTRLVSYVSLLIEQQGFPRPLPCLVTGRRKPGCSARADRPMDSLTHEVTMNSRWQREAVEAWLEDFLPPDNAAAVNAQRERAAANDMDMAATGLRLLNGGRA